MVSSLVMHHRKAAADRRLEPTLDFLRLLWAIEHGLQRASKRMQRDLGVTGPQRLVLRVVGRFPGISAGELARMVRLHPSTITGILQRLTRRGLIERRADPRDNRRARLRLEPAARAYTRKSSNTVEEMVRRALARGGSAKVLAARVVLGDLAERLNDL